MTTLQNTSFCRPMPSTLFKKLNRKALFKNKSVSVKLSSPDAPFPADYSQLIKQVQNATEKALADGSLLLEIEFPTSGLDSVPGDGEGGIEMTESMQYIKEFSQLFQRKGQGQKTRIFFPDYNDMLRARDNIFKDTPYKTDFLSKPTGFEDFGWSNKVKLKERVEATDEVYIAAYPYFNVNEILSVEELYLEVAESGKQPVIIFNGELDRIRSGYYPSFFYPKLGNLAKTFLPKFETVYYIHNFKGRSGGKLFRAYPGPWKVYRGNETTGLTCIHTQETMPSLKEVALNILK